MTYDVDALAVMVRLDSVDLPYMTRPRRRRGVSIARDTDGVRIGSRVLKASMALELSTAICAVTAGSKPRQWARVTSEPRGTTLTVRREGNLICISGTLYTIEAAFEFAAALAKAVQPPIVPTE